jgi:hypothetical protein
MTAEAVGPAVISKVGPAVISKGLMTSKEFDALLTAASSAKHALLFKLFDHSRVGRISIHLITRGRGCPGAASAFSKKRRALVTSRVSESKKSTVAPVESKMEAAAQRSGDVDARFKEP